MPKKYLYLKIIRIPMGVDVLIWQISVYDCFVARLEVTDHNGAYQTHEDFHLPYRQEDNYILALRELSQGAILYTVTKEKPTTELLENLLKKEKLEVVPPNGISSHKLFSGEGIYEIGREYSRLL
jgi:hypothetical protein